MLRRTPGTYVDGTSDYVSNAIIGPISLSLPGEIADATSVSVESSTGTTPTVSVLLNEISGTFTGLSNFVPDPTELPAFSSFHSNMYYLSQSASNLVRQMQLSLAFPADGNLHEVYGYSVYGSLKRK
jgi:hypothetical protein